MEPLLACPGCGKAPMLRNGRRQVTVPRTDAGGVTWHRLDASRLACRGCGRSMTDRDGLRDDLEATLRREIVLRLSRGDLNQVSAWAACDPRTTARHAAREMDGVLDGPLPSDLSIETGGRIAVLAHGITRIVADVVPADEASVSLILAERGGDVGHVAIPLDPAMRGIVKDALPHATVAIHRCDGLARLEALLRDAMGRRDDGSTALLAERVRSGGWNAQAIDRLAAIAARNGSRMAGMFLGAWGEEVHGMLGVPRQGPGASIPTGDPMRARAIVSVARPGGITVNQLIAAMSAPATHRTDEP